MSAFTVYDPRTGKILRSGDCQEHMIARQANTGESVLPVASNPETQWVDLETLTLINVAPAVFEPDYRLKRAREYPDIGDQLDVLWREMQALPLTQEADAMLKRIQAVKAKHPKS